jgi:hypothetical protein
MDELVELISGTVGISEDVAEQAVEVVIVYLKDNLPAPVAGQIDSLLSGTSDADLGGMAKGLGLTWSE